MKSSATTDGAKNELGAAFALVNEDNALHCAAHNIQLVINDQLDRKTANSPPQLHRHRAIVQKCHELVIYINGHRDTHDEFKALASRKMHAEGAHHFQSLVEDVVTRWDSELAMMERLYYFDVELLQIFANDILAVPRDLALDRFEFDLMYAMTLVLTPFKIFTKFVQKKSEVTLAYLPGKIDELISALAPGSFAALVADLEDSDAVLEQLEAFQACLVISIKERFADIFDGASLAMAARFFLPGPGLFAFEHFEPPENLLAVVKDNIVSDFRELLPPMPAEHLELQLTLARGTLDLARFKLDQLDPHADPLDWWGHQDDLSLIHRVVKMLFQIPASSAENERSFSSASFVLDQRRTRLDLDNFRREHRIRRALCAGATPAERLRRSNELIERFSQELLAREPQNPQNPQ